MTQFFNEANSVEAVNARIGADVSPRLKEVMSSLVAHLHAFVKDVQLTQPEWEFAIDFLTRTGQICSEERQEFILLSDTLGVSMLVDALNNRRPPAATENTVMGPFFVAGAPQREMGATISLDGNGESCRFEGRVLDLEGRPVSGARINVWSDNADGFYDVQQPGVQPKWNNRGVFSTGADGRYSFTGIKPVSYPIPHDGPVGTMLTALGRGPYRPAHMHFIVEAAGFQTIVTHTFVGDDAYLGCDAVFGVKDSLVAPFEPAGDANTAWRSRFDFVLTPV
ncbi:6-chlorohydroxyquinol-1,2-dioxygenase [Burkholderia sp. SRS-W-2-2016]|uniref:dioxygenase family protein n=1 Tax=Burkholderia sp. SRS-W-2-2016 TaxID=1926878 RepID=UPI00094B782C|nr:dioxygenase [Burkholderia sp. SRS-W-2-2016]OLL31119.1 6-chlorohydroxyquinol-1,2-dioxygenase [Burkholderia sp. SRS-W-2-2016]